MTDAVATPVLSSQAQIDAAEVALLKARLAVVEATLSNDWSKVKAWVSSNWPHFVTWLTGIAVAAKVGLIADVVKAL